MSSSDSGGTSTHKLSEEQLRAIRLYVRRAEEESRRRLELWVRNRRPHLLPKLEEEWKQRGIPMRYGKTQEEAQPKDKD